jgi:predicted nucleic acid-binding protein
MKFIDTNVFVYFVDRRDMRKQTIARSLIASALGSQQYSITWQVLNEFGNVALSKLAMTEDEVCIYVSRFRNIRMQMPKPEWTERALMIRKQYGIQFYDALIVAAAEASGCDEILTEDLNDGQVYCGVKAVNPFK